LKTGRIAHFNEFHGVYGKGCANSVYGIALYIVKPSAERFYGYHEIGLWGFNGGDDL
jgi:hypothetical protein